MERNGRKGRNGLVGKKEAYVKRNHVTAATVSRSHFPFRDHIPTREALLTRSAALFSLIQNGQLNVSIGGRYPLADAAQAHADLESRATTGKLCCCLDPRSGGRGRAGGIIVVWVVGRLSSRAIGPADGRGPAWPTMWCIASTAPRASLGPRPGCAAASTRSSFLADPADRLTDVVWFREVASDLGRERHRRRADRRGPGRTTAAPRVAAELFSTPRRPPRPRRC